MVANDGNHEGLFRGAFMQSGSPIPVGDITHGQVYYDAIAAETGCSTASDTLACLRSVPYATLKTAVDHTPFIFDYQASSVLQSNRAPQLMYYLSHWRLHGFPEPTGFSSQITLKNLYKTAKSRMYHL